MMILSLQLAILAVLAVVCVVGWRVETSRARAWKLDDKRLPSNTRKLFVAGPEPWVVLGISQETSFENVSATPEIVSSGFELKDEDGSTVSVPSGAKVQIRAIEGARRAAVDAITSGGAVRPRFTFELKPGAVVYTLDASKKPRARFPYRGGATPLLGAGASSLVLAGEPGAITSTVFPGCWLMILLPFVGGGLVAAASGAAVPAWGAIGLAVALLIVGWAALPDPPPGAGDGSPPA